LEFDNLFVICYLYFGILRLLSPIEEIKNRLDIVEVVSGYIKLQKAGRNFRANCPFHHEKTPSLMISPERQIWHCFGCGKGGDIFGFVKEIEGLEFTETLRLLAQRAGVVLKKQDPKIKDAKERLAQICELSVKFFSKQLEEGRTGEKIKKYLLDRGINQESINNWQLGFAPNDWHALSLFLKNKGYSDDEIINSGLVVQKITNDYRQPTTAKNSDAVVYHPLAANNYYDRFRNRIVFPIFDINGQPVGFAGRVAPGQNEDTAKYVNTPQTNIYDKGRILYGLDKAKVEIRAKNYCVVVEGNTDVIMSHQAGISNTVASSGTALTLDHLKIIKRFTDNLFLAFDLDAAGDTATKRAIDLAINQGFNIKIIYPKKTLPNEKVDPADIIKKDPKDWTDAIENAQGVVEFYFASAFGAYDAEKVSGKKEIAKKILPLLKIIPDKIEQAYWLQELAVKLNVPEKSLVEAIKEIKSVGLSARHSEDSKVSQAKIVKPRRLALEEELLAMILSSENIKSKLLDLEAAIKYAGLETLFLNSDLMKMMLNLKEFAAAIKDDGAVDSLEWQNQLSDELRDIANQIVFQWEVMHPDGRDLDKKIAVCLNEMKKETAKKEMAVLQKMIKSAEEKNDKKNLEELVKKFKKAAKGL
jgi:DNA primase